MAETTDDTTPPAHTQIRIIDEDGERIIETTRPRIIRIDIGEEDRSPIQKKPSRDQFVFEFQ